MKPAVTLSPNLSLPVDLAGRRTAVFGISGSGKSSTATVLMEGLLAAGEQVVGIDPKGEMWGLLSLANGKPSNLPIIIFGEPNGHIASLSESHGPKLADFVVETGRSVVLSLLGFESDQSERRFVAAFLRQLYRRKSRQAHATRTLVVLDEAHLFVPENVRGDAAELSGAVQKIVRQGRSFGIGTLLVDQRPQDVAKRVISQCDTLVCHQLVHKTDRDALKDWVRGYDREGRGEQFLESLAALEPGEAWVWSPAWLKLFQRAKVARRRTFDSGAAPDGTATAKTVQRADVDLEELRGQLAEVVEKAKADDPKELRKRILELEKHVRDRPTTPPTITEKIVEREVPVLKSDQLKRVENLIERLEEVGTKALTEVQELKRQLAPALAPKLNPSPARSMMPTPAPRLSPSGSAPRSSPSSNPGTVGNSGLRRIMVALAQRPGLTNRQIGLRAGLSSQSGTFATYLGRGRSAGWIRDEGERRYLTEAGIAALGDFQPLPEGPELLAHWLGELGNSGAARMLRALAEAFPGALSNEQIGTTAGISHASGTFATYLGRLRGLELVESPRRGELRASAELFT